MYGSIPTDLVAEEASLTALTYIDLFLNLSQKMPKQPCIARMLCCASKASSRSGAVAERIAQVLSKTLVSMLRLDSALYKASELGLTGKSCSKNFLDCRLSKFNCD
jgi:hypothetical protein